MKKSSDAHHNKDFRTILRFKVGLIPFNIINFALWALFMGGTLNPFLMVLWLLIPIGMIYTYLILILSSAYSISNLFLLYKSRRVTKKQCIIHTILQLFFIVDVFDSIYLREIEKRLETSVPRVAN